MKFTPFRSETNATGRRALLKSRRLAAPAPSPHWNPGTQDGSQSSVGNPLLGWIRMPYRGSERSPPPKTWHNPQRCSMRWTRPPVEAEKSAQTVRPLETTLWQRKSIMPADRQVQKLGVSDGL